MRWVCPGASGFAGPHVAMVDVGLQISLREVGAFAALHDVAHEKGTTVRLLDALDWVCAAIEGETKFTI